MTLIFAHGDSPITGVNGETGATVGTVDVSNTMHTNAGTYASDYVVLHWDGELQQPTRTITD